MRISAGFFSIAVGGGAHNSRPRPTPVQAHKPAQFITPAHSASVYQGPNYFDYVGSRGGPLSYAEYLDQYELQQAMYAKFHKTYALAGMGADNWAMVGEMSIDDTPQPAPHVPPNTPPPVKAAVKKLAKEAVTVSNPAPQPVTPPTPPPVAVAASKALVRSVMPPAPRDAADFYLKYRQNIANFVLPKDSQLDTKAAPDPKEVLQMADFFASTVDPMVAFARNNQKELERMTKTFADRSSDQQTNALIAQMRDDIETLMRSGVGPHIDEQSGSVRDYDRTWRLASNLKKIFSTIDDIAQAYVAKQMALAQQAAIDHVVDRGKLYGRFMVYAYNDFVEKAFNVPIQQNVPAPPPPPTGVCADPATGTPSGCAPVNGVCPPGCGVFYPSTQIQPKPVPTGGAAGRHFVRRHRIEGLGRLAEMSDGGKIALVVGAAALFYLFSKRG